jgi:hypothetical protein
VRTIALSATYRQNTRREDVLARDPDNRWLARYPVKRLSAEMLRDQALVTSGLLVEKIGGPSVKPYQPVGLWEIAANEPQYQQDHGEKLYRRSLYTYWRRTIPPPTMMLFDAADRSYCTVRRQATSTPLQSLTLVNDPQFVEASRFAGQRMLREGGSSLDAQVAWLFRLLTNRPPTDRELQILKQLYGEQKSHFASNLPAADRYLAIGEAKYDTALDKADLAAASVLALALINHDEAVHCR